jgi:hypothetical protein
VIGICLILFGAHIAGPLAGLPALGAAGLGIPLLGRWLRRYYAALTAASEADAHVPVATATLSATLAALDDWQLREEAARSAERALTRVVMRLAQGVRIRTLEAESELALTLQSARAAEARLDRARQVLASLATSVGIPADASLDEVRHALGLRLHNVEPDTAAVPMPPGRRREHHLLSGWWIERFRAQSQKLVAAPEHRPLVLADPLSGVEPNRREAFLRLLEQQARLVPVAIVASDDEALAWASCQKA